MRQNISCEDFMWLLLKKFLFGSQLSTAHSDCSLICASEIFEIPHEHAHMYNYKLLTLWAKCISFRAVCLVGGFQFLPLLVWRWISRISRIPILGGPISHTCLRLATEIPPLTELTGTGSSSQWPLTFWLRNVVASFECYRQHFCHLWFITVVRSWVRSPRGTDIRTNESGLQRVMVPIWEGR